MDFKFVSLLVIALMLILATPAFAEGNDDSNFSNDSNNSDSNVMVGNDRDEHGCIGSAGESWCEEKQKCLRIWEEECEIEDSNNTLVGNDIDEHGCIPSAGESWCEEKQKCLRSWEEDCEIEDDNEVEANCICTKEYMPVCASIKAPDCNCPEGALCKCAAVKKTFSNKCMANCAGGIVISEGACVGENEVENENNFCGGIAAIQCKEGYTCKLDGNYPDAGGKCVYDCPEYVMPLCEEGKIIISKTNEYGCKKPICVGVTSTSSMYASDFFLGASWVCSNEKEYKEKSDKCMPYAYWKETARKTCAQFIVESCPTNSGDQNIDSNTVRQTCIANPSFVKNFETNDACEVNCKTSIDSEGCKNINCGNGEIKRYCGNECQKQSLEDISELKEKCYAKEGQVIVRTNDLGCTKYYCDKLIEMNEDSNVESSFSSSTCTFLDELPKEKYAICEQTGGKLLVKTNEKNCITVLECVGEKDIVDVNSNKINKEIIKDSVQLFEIALKLEELKIEINKTAVKVQAISDYYKEIGDINASIKFQNAVDLLKIASLEIDSLKEMIKERVDNFTEADALEVKKAVKSIKTEILNKVLMTLLD